MRNPSFTEVLGTKQELIKPRLELALPSVACLNSNIEPSQGRVVLPGREWRSNTEGCLVELKRGETTSWITFPWNIDQVRSWDWANAIQMASSSQGQDHREESKKLELKMNFLKVSDSDEEDY